MAPVRPLSLEDKFKAVQAMSDSLDAKNKTINSLIRLGTESRKPILYTPTGLPTLDHYVLGCGGWPDGRMIEIFGPESSGKTSLCLHSIAQEQKKGNLAAFVDAEHALDKDYAKTLGVDTENLIFSQPDNGEQAIEAVIGLVKSMAVSLIVVDSVAALVPEAELMGDVGSSHVGLQARLMSQAMRMLVGITEKNKVKIIWTNQIREKIGVMFGSPETTTGGRALKFYSSVRIDVRRREVIKDGTGDSAPIVGHELELKAIKNKVGSPLRSTKISLYYPGTRFVSGFDVVGDTINYASKLGIFQMSGSWYSLGTDRLANGFSNLKERLINSPKELKAIQDKIAANKDTPEETL